MDLYAVFLQLSWHHLDVLYTESKTTNKPRVIWSLLSHIQVEWEIHVAELLAAKIGVFLLKFPSPQIFTEADFEDYYHFCTSTVSSVIMAEANHLVNSYFIILFSPGSS